MECAAILDSKAKRLYIDSDKKIRKNNGKTGARDQDLDAGLMLLHIPDAEGEFRSGSEGIGVAEAALV